MVVRQPSKLFTWVRFPSPAPRTPRAPIGAGERRSPPRARVTFSARATFSTLAMASISAACSLVRRSADSVRRVPALLLLTVLLVSCADPGRVASSSPTAQPSASPTVRSLPSPSAQPVQLGPGGLTLDQEIGAVMMVGFQGSLTSADLADWSRRQFGGLLVVNGNRN